MKVTVTWLTRLVSAGVHVAPVWDRVVDNLVAILAIVERELAVGDLAREISCLIIAAKSDCRCSQGAGAIYRHKQVHNFDQRCLVQGGYGMKETVCLYKILSPDNTSSTV